MNMINSNGKTAKEILELNLGYEKEILEILKEHPKKDYHIIGFFVKSIRYEDTYEKNLRVQRTLARLVRKKKIIGVKVIGSNLCKYHLKPI